MKKLYTTLASLLLLTVLVLPAVSVSAQTLEADNQDIQNRLEQEGLDEAPAPIEVDDVEWSGEAPSSGFVDEDGNPISEEEYEKIREENSKGIFEKQPWIIPVVIAAVAGVALAVVLKKRK